MSISSIRITHRAVLHDDGNVTLEANKPAGWTVVDRALHPEDRETPGKGTIRLQDGDMLVSRSRVTAKSCDGTTMGMPYKLRHETDNTSA